MGIVSGFKHDLFVSYAHFDNEEDAHGFRWVSRFQLDLRNVLRQRLGEEPQVFFDTRSFEASDHVDFLAEHARQSAIFVAVFSPSYVAREFPLKELEAFCTRPSANHPVVVVELLPVDEERHPPLLRGRKRTPFWRTDPLEQDVPLPLTPQFNPEAYNERLQVLAHQVRKLLIEQRGTPRASVSEAPQPMPQAAKAGDTPASQTVLLAQSTDDLYEDRERVRAYLEQFQIKILPESDYPQGGAEFAAAFDADVARAGAFVQLLGSFASRKPPDLPKTYSQYQYETAKERGLKIFQWRRPGLDLDAISHRDRPLLEGPDVLAVGLEEFKGEVLRFCRQAQAKPLVVHEGSSRHIFINADRSDKELADALLQVFADRKDCSAARPLFEGSAEDIVKDLEDNLLSCEGLLLLYGSAPPAWVRAQLLRYNKLEPRRETPPRFKSIVFGPPAPKPELGWSTGSFDKLDCQDGEFQQRLHDILAGLQL